MLKYALLQKLRGLENEPEDATTSATIVPFRFPALEVYNDFRVPMTY